MTTKFTPSTANHELNDPTMTRCMRRAEKLGYTSLYRKFWRCEYVL